MTVAMTNEGQNRRTFWGFDIPTITERETEMQCEFSDRKTWTEKNVCTVDDEIDESVLVSRNI